MGRTTTHVDWAIGTQIYRLRKEKGLTQTELGLKIGVTFQQIQKYENGMNRPCIESLIDLAKALDVPVEFFINVAKEAKEKGFTVRDWLVA